MRLLAQCVSAHSCKPIKKGDRTLTKVLLTLLDLDEGNKEYQAYSWFENNAEIPEFLGRKAFFRVTSIHKESGKILVYLKNFIEDEKPNA